MSSEDIDKGARWSTDIAKELENSTFGILCVTKENLEAPWLSFEAGALSKTMEKSYVTPFLFDIKRSEVQGPILQFQSTIFQKADLKKMINTLNKACGESCLSESMLDKSFEVWYPTLETNLNGITSKKNNNIKVEVAPKFTKEPEMLEEILDLTRDNQKLLRNPDEKLYATIEKIQQSIDQISVRNTLLTDKKRISRKFNSIFFDDIAHIFGTHSKYGFLMALSVFKEDFPWIYDMGKELIDLLNSNVGLEEKNLAIKDYKNLIDITFRHPIIREVYGQNKDGYIFMRELPYILMEYLDNISENNYDFKNNKKLIN